MKQDILKEINDNLKEEVAKDLFSQFKEQCEKIKKDIDTLEEEKAKTTEKFKSFEKYVAPWGQQSESCLATT